VSGFYAKVVYLPLVVFFVVSSPSKRAITYLNIFTHYVDGEFNDDMSGSINQILVIGRIEFKEHIEVSIGRRIQPKLQGRSLMKKTEN